MTIGERIKARRLEIGLSVDQLAEAIGKNRATVYRYESNEIEKYTIDVLYPLADALRTTPGYLMGWDDSSNDGGIVKLGDDAMEVGGKSISVTGRAGAGKSMVLAENIIPLPQMRKIPLIGSIACGAPILAEEHIEEYIDIPKHISADFALTCKGDSMINARIFDGDIVYIRQQDTVDNGEIAAVLIDTEATLKRVQLFEDHISLEPENPQYRPLVYWGEDMNNVRILGKAMAFTSAIR